MHKLYTFAAAVAATLAVGTAARADFIDFTTDTVGLKSNGFVSTQSSRVAFSDSLGADLILSNFTPQSAGNGLAVFGDDPSILIMDFTESFTNLSLDFGNDDPGFSSPGDRAVLTLFDGATQVGQVSVALNRNDLLDQTLSYSGAAFNKATFAYTNAGGTPINLIEIVDNINFSGEVTAVPAPAGVVLGAVGFATMGLGRLVRRRKVVA